jgi:hypothetical protein
MSCHANEFAPFGQKDCADFTQKGRKLGRRFWGAGHWVGDQHVSSVGAIWAPFNIGGPFLCSTLKEMVAAVTQALVALHGDFDRLKLRSK